MKAHSLALVFLTLVAGACNDAVVAPTSSESGQVGVALVPAGAWADITGGVESGTCTFASIACATAFIDNEGEGQFWKPLAETIFRGSTVKGHLGFIGWATIKRNGSLDVLASKLMECAEFLANQCAEEEEIENTCPWDSNDIVLATTHFAWLNGVKYSRPMSDAKHCRRELPPPEDQCDDDGNGDPDPWDKGEGSGGVELRMERPSRDRTLATARPIGLPRGARSNLCSPGGGSDDNPYGEGVECHDAQLTLEIYVEGTGWVEIWSGWGTVCAFVEE